MTMYGTCIIDTVQCVTTKMPMNHTMYDPNIATTMCADTMCAS